MPGGAGVGSDRAAAVPPNYDVGGRVDHTATVGQPGVDLAHQRLQLIVVHVLRLHRSSQLNYSQEMRFKE